MTVEQHNVVDFVARDGAARTTSLVISDHLPWENVKEHLFFLQEKLNRYLQFIESGQFVRDFPASSDDRIKIEIYLKDQFPDTAQWFFDKASSVTNAKGYSLNWRVASL